MVLVWAADVFAYFFGKALGGRWIKTKLAVTISPGKSWEGVLGGMLGVLLVALVWAEVDQALAPADLSLFSLLWTKGWWVALPGHGGVLDRIDALLPTLPLAMMLVFWI